jgi:hypothetical protein
LAVAEMAAALGETFMRRARINIKALTVTLAVLILVTSTRADTYITFTTMRYYSANRRYYVEVTPKRRATLYRAGSRRPTRQWIRVLPELPERLLVTNDGKRVRRLYVSTVTSLRFTQSRRVLNS